MSDRSDPLFDAEQAAQQAWRSSDVTQDRVAQEDAKWTMLADVLLEDFNDGAAYIVDIAEGREAGDDDGLAWERLPLTAYALERSDSFRLSAWGYALETAPQPLRVCGFCQHSPPHDPLRPEIDSGIDAQLLVALRWLAQTRILRDEELKRGTHSAVAAGAATRLDFCRVSVSVGAMIVAARLVDVPIVVFGFASPNALLGVAWNDPLLPLSASADTGANPLR